MTPIDETNGNIARKIISYLENGKIQKKLLKFLTIDYCLWLNEQVRLILKEEPNVVYLEGKFVIVGDLHGNFNDLDRILSNTWKKENIKFVFLGDYVDRGHYSYEVISLLFTMKLLFPNRVLLLRGNHENQDVTEIYGFKDECLSKSSKAVYRSFLESFRTLPLCAILNYRVFCVHGGISQYIKTIAQINEINRFCEIPDSGPMMDLLWADPDEEVDEFEESDRGDTYRFGISPTLEFLKINHLSLIIRGHECVEDGFEYPFEVLDDDYGKCILSIFSASDYVDYRNDAAYGVYDRKIEFHSLPLIKEISNEHFESDHLHIPQNNPILV